MKKLSILLTLFFAAAIVAKSQTVQDSFLLNTKAAQPKINSSGRYFSFAYEHESGGGPRNGVSFSYMGNPGGKGTYYCGVRSSVLIDNKKSSAMEYNLNAITIDFTQRFFIGRGTKVLPFIDLDFGYRYVNNSAEVPIVYGAKAGGIFGAFGLRNYTGGESTKIINYAAFSGDLGIGCFFNMRKYKGLFIKLGYKYTGKFQLIDKGSLGTTTNNTTPEYELGYNTYSTKPGFVTLSMGVMIGRGKPIRE